MALPWVTRDHLAAYLASSKKWSELRQKGTSACERVRTLRGALDQAVGSDKPCPDDVASVLCRVLSAEEQQCLYTNLAAKQADVPVLV